MNDPLDRSLNGLIPQKMVPPEARRIAVDHASREYGVSQRRGCKALGVDRSSIRYASVRTDDGDLRVAMKKVASERRRFGYRPSTSCWNGRVSS